MKYNLYCYHINRITQKNNVRIENLIQLLIQMDENRSKSMYVFKSNILSYDIMYMVFISNYK